MKNEKKSNNSFLLLLFYIGKFTFCQKTYLDKLSLYCYICFTVFFTWQVIGNAVTLTPIQIFIDFVDAILRFKVLDNNLTQMLIAMDYFCYFYISDIYLQSREKKDLNLGNQFHYKKYKERDLNTSKTFVFIFHHSI